MRPVRGSKTFITPPLDPEETFNTHKGLLDYKDILGKKPRDVIVSKTGDKSKFMLHHPSLEDYVTRVRRVVTPIYPMDAATIVTHLDIHVDPILEGEDPAPVEILESGTGHGSLTLALCKAIHAANPPGFQQGAILHTVDISSQHSKVARSVVEGFRRGMYKRDVQFYINNPATWIEEEYERRGSKEPFLSAAVLDLPDVHEYLHTVSTALKLDAPLGVFCPSVTQIGACVQAIRNNKDTRLVLEKCVEFNGAEAGGREWDVRLAKVRASEAPAAVEGEAVADNAESGSGDVRWEMVCRPMVGKYIVGGGFYAVFRKKEPYQSGGETDWNKKG